MVITRTGPCSKVKITVEPLVGLLHHLISDVSVDKDSVIFLLVDSQKVYTVDDSVMPYAM